MSDTIRLPKEVAEAIEALRSRDFKVSNHDILFIFAESYNNGYPALVKFSQNHFDTLLSALVNGFEIEQTPEDKVREYYESCLEKIRYAKDSLKSKEYQGTRDGIRKTLDLLNIKIKGVNAE